MACCAVMVCNLFVNYLIDVSAVKDSIDTAQLTALYNAQVATARVVCAVSGGCLVITTAITLLFYIGSYVDKRAKDMGILKAMGYTDMQIASRFAIFGLSVLLGCAIGYALSYAIMPSLYAAQSKELIPIDINFNAITLLMPLLPPIAFSALSVAWAYRKLKRPLIDLIKGKRVVKVKNKASKRESKSFLMRLSLNALSGNKALIFFMAFSSFCFSSMTQMSISMLDVGKMFSIMIMVIGLVLALMTLIMSLSSVVKNHAPTIAIMNACGWRYSDCKRAILGAYRPIAWIGFAIGSAYQYMLLKLVMDIAFNDVAGMPAYNFDLAALGISIAAFIVVYEIIIQLYAIKLRRMTLKAVVGDNL